MIGIPLPNIFDGWASHTGCCEGATAEKAVPFPSDRPSILLPQQINPGASSWIPQWLVGSRWVTASSGSVKIGPAHRAQLRASLLIRLRCFGRAKARGAIAAKQLH